MKKISSSGKKNQHTLTPISNVLQDALSYAKKKGADQTDLMLVEGTGIQYIQRMGKLEKLERAETADLGIRLFQGQRQVMVSTSDLSSANIKNLIDRGLSTVQLVPEDKYCGLATSDQLVKDVPILKTVDPVEPTIALLQERAAACEEAALSVPKITNSEGVESTWSHTTMHFLASNGFSESYSNTRHALSIAVIARDGDGMERDYESNTVIFADDLNDPVTLGRKAALQAVQRLNPKRIGSQKKPVIFHPRVGSSFLAHLAAAINGASVNQGASFLKNKLGQQIFTKNITVIDNPNLNNGLGSRPFDAEGLACKNQAIIDQGVLTSWLLDLRSARQMGKNPTGHGVRDATSLPSAGISNFYMQTGQQTPDQLIKDVRQGLYVTELIGNGVNQITGDYSRGATGFWIEDGTLAYPVSEITIAGNLNDIFANLIVANDLQFDYRINTPTLMVESLMIAGQ